MNVLQLHASYRQPAGEDTVVDAEAALLRAGGHEVVQHLAPNPAGAVPSVGLLAQAPWNISSSRTVAHLLREVRPDIVHVHNTWFALSASVFAPLRRAGVPVVMTLHNYRWGCIGRDLYRDGATCTDCLGRSPLPGVVHGCYRGSRLLSALSAAGMAVHRRRTLPRSVHRYIAPTDFAAGLLVRAGVERHRLVVKPHFTPDPGPRRQVSSASRDLLYVGRLAPGKGVEELLAAWGRRAAPPGGGLRLVLVGDGPLRAELERSVPAGVELVGWEDHGAVLERMLGARALVFPSTWYEPFGMVLIEALAAGLPVIGFDVAAVRAIVQPVQPTVLVPVGDVDGLAEAIDALEDDALVDELGRQGRRRYEAEFTGTRNLPLLEAVYQSVL